MIGSVKSFMKRGMDSPTLALCGNKLVAAGVDYFSYQRKRALRRRLLAQMEKAGHYGKQVLGGPFAGMRYPSEGYVSCSFQKIVGSYEHELHGLMDWLIKQGNFTHLVNIGAADGYVAIGCTLAMPSVRTFAFEADAEKLVLLRRVTELNAVTNRVTLCGRCGPEELKELEKEIDPPRTMVICDVDGYEIELLTQGRPRWLDQAEILLELHDCLRPGVTDLINAAFLATHHCIRITNQGVKYEDFPFLRDLTFQEINALIDEDRRGIQDWYFMTPHQDRHEKSLKFGPAVAVRP
jgi:hypothetical protein